MVLKVLGSSSSGNCYILDNGSEALILEAGVRFSEVKKALDYNLRKVEGCLITHQHNDHAKYLKNMLDAGFNVLALPEVFQSKALSGYHSKEIQPGKGYRLGNFKVLPFQALHDVPCVGYHIMHPDIGSMMFLTDSCECLAYFRGLNNILIECNYSTPRLIQAVNEGRTLKSQIERLPNSHMELQTCKTALADMDLTQVRNIVLIHLSDNNSDRDLFVSEISRQTGKIVYAAHPGLEIDLTTF